jgi:hypothetical protein
MDYLMGVLLFTIANIMAWFQFNSQFVWPWWEDKPIFTSLIFAVPLGVCYWYAVRYIVLSTDELWASKLVGFGVGNIVFAVLTYFIAKESMLTPKTMVCLSLAMVIILVQILWK